MVCSPTSVFAGTVNVSVATPFASDVTDPSSTGSECMMKSTVSPGLNPVPLTVTLSPGAAVSVEMVAVPVGAFAPFVVPPGGAFTTGGRMIFGNASTPWEVARRNWSRLSAGTPFAIEASRDATS